MHIADLYNSYLCEVEILINNVLSLSETLDEYHFGVNAQALKEDKISEVYELKRTYERGMALLWNITDRLHEAKNIMGKVMDVDLKTIKTTDV